MQPVAWGVRRVPGLLLTIGTVLSSVSALAQAPAGASNVPPVSQTPTVSRPQTTEAEARPRQATLIKVTKLRVENTKAFTSKQITAVLGTRVSSRFFWGRKRYFDRRTFDDDLKRVVRFYQTTGIAMPA